MCLVVSVVNGILALILLAREPMVNRPSPLDVESSLDSVDELVIESRCLNGTISSPSALMTE